MTAVEKGHANRLFYLALPPSVFKSVTSMLKVSIIIIIIIIIITSLIECRTIDHVIC